nr:response regulator [Lysinibacillus timonensis]
MYKVIVVEDDRIIRRGICQSIKWEEHGFIIAGEAGDGEMALDLIEKEQPQVVISDINMPFMDGLEMAKKIREISPDTRIIFLTGYEDFKYAQQAVKLKVYDYLLKPVQSEQLLHKVKEAAADWELETKKQKRMIESLPYLQRKFFHDLMKGGEKWMDMEKELAELGIELEGPEYAAVLIHSPIGFHDECKRMIREILSTFFLQENFAVINIDRNEYAILLSLEDENDVRRGQLVQELFNYSNALEHFVTITLGRTYPNLFELGKSLLEARLALDMRHIMGTGKVFSYEDIATSKEETESCLKEIQLELENQIKLGIPEKVSETLKELNKTILRKKSVPLTELKIIALKFSTMLFFEVEKWRKEENTSFNSSDVYQDIIKMETLSEMMEILNRLIQQWRDEMYKKEEKNHFSHVDQAIMYIKDHFHDSSLTLKKVAEYIHVSTPYLSNLFKLEKGINFGDFLLELRMKKAMEELRKGDQKTYEVCEKVGYNNPQYFSICFKKFTGYTPAEYKKQFK